MSDFGSQFGFRYFDKSLDYSGEEDDDDEDNGQFDEFDPKACASNCCDEDCECDDCVRCSKNGLNNNNNYELDSYTVHASAA